MESEPVWDAWYLLDVEGGPVTAKYVARTYVGWAEPIPIEWKDTGRRFFHDQDRNLYSVKIDQILEQVPDPD